MYETLLVIHMLLSIALIGIILLQRSDNDGFGIGSGSGMNILSGRAKANFLTRTTAILASLFIVGSLVLSILARPAKDESLLQKLKDPELTVDELLTDNQKRLLGGGEIKVGEDKKDLQVPIGE